MVAKDRIPVKLQATEWDKALQNLQTGRADVIDTIFQTAARSKTLDFSRPYASIEVPIFFHQSIGGISDVSSRRGFTVGVKEGDADIDWLMAHGIRNFKQYPNYEALIRAAGNNEIRVFVADQPPALYYLTKFNLQDQFRDSAPLYSGQFHWATRKGDGTLHQIVARGFAQITPDERRRIRDKWIGRTLGAARLPRRDVAIGRRQMHAPPGTAFQCLGGACGTAQAMMLMSLPMVCPLILTVEVGALAAETLPSSESPSFVASRPARCASPDSALA